MFEAAQIVRVTPGEPARIIASRALVDDAAPALAMHSVARTLDTLRPWVENLGLAPAGGHAAGHALVLTALGAAAPWDTLAEVPDALHLLVDTGALANGADETPGDLATAMQAGLVPLPAVAVPLAALGELAASEDPVLAPVGPRLAADWIAAGRPVRLVPADAAGTPVPALEGAVAALRHLVGHVPLALLNRLGALAGDTGLTALRARHARLNGDVLAAIAADPATAAAFRAAGCALKRPVRKADTPAPWSEEVFTTELGRYGVERAWLGAQIARSRRTLASLEALRTRDTCLIVGNGGSLAQADPAIFAAHDVIVSNFAFNSPLLARHAKILTVTNALVAEQGAAGFNASQIPMKVAPMWLAGVLHEAAGFSFVNATGEVGFFGEDPAEKISWAATVSFFNLQLAYALGYRRALLVGFDHSYVQPTESQLGDVLDQAEDDPNHFDTLYFKKRRWQAADTAAMEDVYRLARAAWEADGRDVLNISPASKLTVFDRHDPAAPLPPIAEAAPAERAPAVNFAVFAELDEVALTAREDTAAGRGFSCASAKVSDTLDSGNYKHLVCALTDVKAGRRSWAYIYLKLQQFNGEPYLELRQGDFVPAGFIPWPIPDADTWGSYLRAPLDTPERTAQTLAHFAAGLGVEDRNAFTTLVEAIPDLVRSALAETGDVASDWHNGLSSLEAASQMAA